MGLNKGFFWQRHSVTMATWFEAASRPWHTKCPFPADIWLVDFHPLTTDSSAALGVLLNSAGIEFILHICCRCLIHSTVRNSDWKCLCPIEIEGSRLPFSKWLQANESNYIIVPYTLNRLPWQHGHFEVNFKTGHYFLSQLVSDHTFLPCNHSGASTGQQTHPLRWYLSPHSHLSAYTLVWGDPFSRLLGLPGTHQAMNIARWLAGLLSPNLGMQCQQEKVGEMLSANSFLVRVFIADWHPAWLDKGMQGCDLVQLHPWPVWTTPPPKGGGHSPHNGGGHAPPDDGDHTPTPTLMGGAKLKWFIIYTHSGLNPFKPSQRRERS